jgi:dihydrofolate synthase/folylpolyglutamate synthase
MRTLSQWLDYQQAQHPREIELGLERVRAVALAMGLPRPAPLVITVGGTNGKGSTVAFLEAMLADAGYRVGAYTSPHLLRYNERVRIDAREATDVELVAAFERIDAARAGVSLTYFEFGTLAALALFAAHRVDVALLEVGLGGRLDAVNIVDADAAIVTTVDLDHQDWLGADRAAIAREKAGIFRAGRPAIVGESDPPAALLEEARRIGAHVQRAAIDFENSGIDRFAGWTWTHADGARLELPQPALAAPAQLANAAAAIAAVHALGDKLRVAPAAIASGVARATLPARLQRVAGPIETIVDVAHNPQAARELAAWLQRHPVSGATHAVFSALGDKDLVEIVRALRGAVAHWHLAGLRDETPRGLSAEQLGARLAGVLDPEQATLSANIAQALERTHAHAREGDRIVVFGSFYTAAAALRAVGTRPVGDR